MNASATGSYAVQRGRKDVVVAVLDTGAEVLPVPHPDIAPTWTGPATGWPGLNAVPAAYRRLVGKSLRWAALGLAASVLAIVAGCTPASSPQPRPSVASWPAPVPAPSTHTSRVSPGAPDHVLIVVFENKASGEVAGSRSAPYLNALMEHSAVYTDFRAETHPSEPNYLAMFSGSTHGVTSDACPVRLHGAPNLGRQLLDAGRMFIGYSEGLPHAGYTGCGTGRYARKHNPWVDFDNLPDAVNQPADAMPSDYARLPTVSFLVPDLCHDMHDCPISTGDAWAQSTLDPYARWAYAHNSALIITFDENDGSRGNRVLTLIYGARTIPGRYAQPANHYNLLATIEQWYGLTRLGNAAGVPVLPNAWR